MSLTEQQERFCQLIAQGKNQTDAYIEAGYKCKGPEVARANASRLIANANIAARLAALRSEAAQEAQIDLAWLIREAVATYTAAKSDKAYGPAVSALKEVGILTGERIEKSQRENINRNADELDETELLNLARSGSAGVAGPADRPAQLN